MATSSYFPTSNNYIKYWFEVIQTSQSISGNYSTVTVKLWAKRTNTGYTTWGDGSVSCTVNGTAFPDTGSYTITSTPVCLRSVTGFKVNHNSDGTKSLTVSGSIAIPGAGLSSSSHSFTTSLTTIPRTSSFSLSSSSVNAGSAITVNITRASTSFTHKVNFSFGSHSVSLGSSVATSVSYTIPLSYLDAIPSSTSGSAKIVVDTYNGSTKIGSTSKTFTITAPSSVVPSFSSLGITRVDNGVPSAWGIYVKGRSKATLAINGASGVYGSSISRYSISGGGYSTTSSSFTTGVLNTVGTNTFTATITDSRGRIATKSVTCSVIDYFTPYINYVEVFRCNSSGVADNDGTYIKARANFSYASLSGKNTFSANVSYAKSNTTTWSTPVSISNNTYTSALGGGAISVDSSYDIKFRVADYFTSHEIFEIVPTPSVTMDFKKGGNGVAIGKVAEIDNVLDIGWDGRFRKKLTVDDTIETRTLDVSGFSAFMGGIHVNDNMLVNCDATVNGILYCRTAVKVNDKSVEAPSLIYNYSNGILIDLAPASALQRMITVVITGNGYGVDPINTIIQGYHYTPQGTIIQCKQTNYGAQMRAAIFMIHGGRLKVWTEQPTAYCTLNIRAFCNGWIENSISVGNSALPAGTNLTTCSLRSLGGGVINSDITVNGDVNISGGYLKVGGKNFRGWGFSSGNVYYLGLSGDDKYIRMYNNDISVMNGISYLGSPSGRFIKLYSTQAVDVSSDIRRKTNILTYDEKIESFYDKLKPISYELINGHSGRKHYGFIAQEVESAMNEVGLDYKDMALLQKAPMDAEGNEIDPTTIVDYSTDERIVDYEYSLAYTEMISINTHMIQKLRAEITKLKNEISEIKGLG